jgi:hypothetical protein
MDRLVEIEALPLTFKVLYKVKSEPGTRAFFGKEPGHTAYF